MFHLLSTAHNLVQMLLGPEWPENDNSGLSVLVSFTAAETEKLFFLSLLLFGTLMPFPFFSGGTGKLGNHCGWKRGG